MSSGRMHYSGLLPRTSTNRRRKTFFDDLRVGYQRDGDRSYVGAGARRQVEIDLARLSWEDVPNNSGALEEHFAVAVLCRHVDTLRHDMRRSAVVDFEAQCAIVDRHVADARVKKQFIRLEKDRQTDLAQQAHMQAGVVRCLRARGRQLFEKQAIRFLDCAWLDHGSNTDVARFTRTKRHK